MRSLDTKEEKEDSPKEESEQQKQSKVITELSKGVSMPFLLVSLFKTI